MQLTDYIALIAIGISIASIVLSQKNAKVQGQLTERLNEKETVLDRRKFVVSLWDNLANLWEIRPSDAGMYDETLILDNLNSLELIAVCWENEIVDQNMIFLVCGRNFILRVQEIKAITSSLPHLRRTGPELLQDRPAIARVQAKIETHLSSGETP